MGLGGERMRVGDCGGTGSDHGLELWVYSGAIGGSRGLCGRIFGVRPKNGARMSLALAGEGDEADRA